MISLAEIERLRYDEPQKSVRLAERALEEERGLSRALQIGCELGLSLKSCGRHLEALECLEDVRMAALRNHENLTAADALWRISRTQQAQGLLAGALETASLAVIEAGRQGQSPTLGRSYAARAAALHHLGRFGESRQDYQAAACTVVSETDKAAVAVCLFHNARKQGLQTAPLNLDFKKLPKSLAVEVVWIRAETLPPEEAAPEFMKLVEHYLGESNWLQAGLAGSELLLVLSKLGRFSEAKVVAGKLCPLCVHLEKNALAEGAISTLLSAALCQKNLLAGAAESSARIFRSAILQLQDDRRVPR